MTTTVRPSAARPDTRPSRAGTVLRWFLQVVLALQFLAAGATKLAGDPAMVEMFEQIGAGQWLRLVVGALELAGAVGLLVPRVAAFAAVGLAALMVGATITNVAILDAGPALTVALGLIAGLVAWLRRRDLTMRRPAPSR